MKQGSQSDLFPPGFPSELAAEAFVHLKEAASRPVPAAASVEWLGADGYAVLGTELWRPEQGLIQSLPYFQAVSEKDNETWDSFAARGAAETLSYLKAVEREFVEHGDVFVNVTWVSEDQFKKLKAGMNSA